jgi:hypothetical protein
MGLRMVDVSQFPQSLLTGHLFFTLQPVVMESVIQLPLQQVLVLDKILVLEFFTTYAANSNQMCLQYAIKLLRPGSFTKHIQTGELDTPARFIHYTDSNGYAVHGFLQLFELDTGEYGTRLGIRCELHYGTAARNRFEGVLVTFTRVQVPQPYSTTDTNYPNTDQALAAATVS